MKQTTLCLQGSSRNLWQLQSTGAEVSDKRADRNQTNQIKAVSLFRVFTYTWHS